MAGVLPACRAPAEQALNGAQSRKNMGKEDVEIGTRGSPAGFSETPFHLVRRDQNRIHIKGAFTHRMLRERVEWVVFENYNMTSWARDPAKLA